MTASAEPGRIVLACCPMGPLVLAVDAAHVTSVWDRASEPARKPAGRAVDLAQVYGVEAPGETELRRYIDLTDRGNRWSILAGTQVLVRELPVRPRPLPAFVSGLALRASISGVVDLSGRYAFVLDLAQLEAHERGSGDGVAP